MIIPVTLCVSLADFSVAVISKAKVKTAVFHTGLHLFNARKTEEMLLSLACETFWGWACAAFLGNCDKLRTGLAQRKCVQVFPGNLDCCLLSYFP